MGISEETVFPEFGVTSGDKLNSEVPGGPIFTTSVWNIRLAMFGLGTGASGVVLASIFTAVGVSTFLIGKSGSAFGRARASAGFWREDKFSWGFVGCFWGNIWLDVCWGGGTQVLGAMAGGVTPSCFGNNALSCLGRFEASASGNSGVVTIGAILGRLVDGMTTEVASFSAAWVGCLEVGAAGTRGAPLVSVFFFRP